MNGFRNALSAVTVSACVLTAAGIARAGIITHTADDADHLALAAQPQYDAVGVAKRLNTQSQIIVDSSGILIADTWVLTAAHTEIAKGWANSTFEIAGEVRNVIDTYQHPNFNNDIQNGWDVALLKLDTPITSVSPAQLYTGTAASLVGQTLTYVGYGRSGTGDTGETIGAGTKRAGKNIGEQLGFTLNPGASQVVYSDHILFADMDDPAGGGPLVYGNPLGGTNAISLEFLIALGDSGGGLFVEDNGQHYLAGVHSVLFDYDPSVQNGGFIGYGDVMGSTTLAAALDWIIDTITPEPIEGDLNGDGFVGIGDLNIVLGLWNQNVAAGELLQGDPSGDGFVGIADLNIVLGNWNQGTAPPIEQLTGIVPEPGTLALLTVAGLCLNLRRGR